MVISVAVFAALHGLGAALFFVHLLLAYPFFTSKPPSAFLAVGAFFPVLALAVLPDTTALVPRLVLVSAAAAAAAAALRTPTLLQFVLPLAAFASATLVFVFVPRTVVGDPTKWTLVALAGILIASSVFRYSLKWYRRRSYTSIPSLQTTENSTNSAAELSIERRKIPPSLCNASALTVLYFHWLQPLVSTGRRRPLEIADVPSLADNLASKFCSTELFRPKWDRQTRLENTHPSLWKALSYAFGPKLLLGGILKAVNDWCVCCIVHLYPLICS